MKILNVSSSDVLGGGSGIAAYRLHKGLLKIGVESRMLVRRKGTNDPTVEEVGSFAPVDSCSLEVDRNENGRPHQPIIQQLNSWRVRRMVRVRGWLGARLVEILGMKGASLNVFPTGLHKVLNASDADVIHLHWPHGEMISIREIAKINKPLVWTLHDCWPFLGAEHHSSAEYWRCSEDRGQKIDDSEQPSAASNQQPSTRVALHNAVNKWIFRKKMRSWPRLNVSFVAPCDWMAEQMQQSRLFAAAPVTVIPNGLDLNVFQPLEKSECRQHFNLPLDKKLILFGAYNPMDPNKGIDLLEKALLALPEDDRKDVELVVFGANGSRNIAGLKTHWMGVIPSEKEMAALYNTSDVVCVPSRRESFGQTASEAIACGVPVVAFRTSGLIDIVDHKKTGYLADPFSIESFAQGVQWLLQQRTDANEPKRDRLNENIRSVCRSKALAEFSVDVILNRYRALYESVSVH